MTYSSSGAVVFAMSRRAERQVVRTLREQGAVSADKAIPLSIARLGGYEGRDFLFELVKAYAE